MAIARVPMANAIQTMIITEDSPDRSPASDH